MIAKSHYEEINSILGHFIAAVEGIHLEAPRPNVIGYDESWQVCIWRIGSSGIHSELQALIRLTHTFSSLRMRSNRMMPS